MKVKCPQPNCGHEWEMKSPQHARAGRISGSQRKWTPATIKAMSLKVKKTLARIKARNAAHNGAKNTLK